MKKIMAAQAFAGLSNDQKQAFLLAFMTEDSDPLDQPPADITPAPIPTPTAPAVPVIAQPAPKPVAPIPQAAHQTLITPLPMKPEKDHKKVVINHDVSDKKGKKSTKLRDDLSMARILRRTGGGFTTDPARTTRQAPDVPSSSAIDLVIAEDAAEYLAEKAAVDQQVANDEDYATALQLAEMESPEPLYQPGLLKPKAKRSEGKKAWETVKSEPETLYQMELPLGNLFGDDEEEVVEISQTEEVAQPPVSYDGQVGFLAQPVVQYQSPASSSTRGNGSTGPVINIFGNNGTIYIGSNVQINGSSPMESQQPQYPQQPSLPQYPQQPSPRYSHRHYNRQQYQQQASTPAPVDTAPKKLTPAEMYQLRLNLRM